MESASGRSWRRLLRPVWVVPGVSILVVGAAMPARKPSATAPTASPSGFSSAMPTTRWADCLTSPVLGVASLTDPAAPVILLFTDSTLSVTESLARLLTSVL